MNKKEGLMNNKERFRNDNIKIINCKERNINTKELNLNNINGNLNENNGNLNENNRNLNENINDLANFNNEKFKVYLRVRKSLSPGPWNVKNGKLYQRIDLNNELEFNCFKYVFRNEDTEFIYENYIKSSIINFINGRNCTIFAYGQTGSGKTYTMLGNNNGIINKSLETIFQMNINRLIHNNSFLQQRIFKMNDCIHKNQNTDHINSKNRSVDYKNVDDESKSIDYKSKTLDYKIKCNDCIHDITKYITDNIKYVTDSNNYKNDSNDYKNNINEHNRNYKNNSNEYRSSIDEYKSSYKKTNINDYKSDYNSNDYKNDIGLKSILFDEYKIIPKISISYLEIYNEQVYDLIDRNKKLRIYSVENKLILSNLTKVSVMTLKEAMNILEKSEKNRQISSTEFNERSSRSHTLFQIEYIVGEKISVLNLIDLAGSEKAASTKERRTEGAYINRSLLALSSVVESLISNTYANFRNSKLTRILQNSMIGDVELISLCMINEHEKCFDESVSTLNFASRMSQIKRKPKLSRMNKNEEKVCPLCLQPLLLENKGFEAKEETIGEKNVNERLEVDLSDRNGNSEMGLSEKLETDSSERNERLEIDLSERNLLKRVEITEQIINERMINEGLRGSDINKELGKRDINQEFLSNEETSESKYKMNCFNSDKIEDIKIYSDRNNLLLNQNEKSFTVEKSSFLDEKFSVEERSLLLRRISVLENMVSDLLAKSEEKKSTKIFLLEKNVFNLQYDLLRKRYRRRELEK